MNAVYHQCRGGQQRPGHREDCRRCNPQIRRELKAEIYGKVEPVSEHMIRGLAASLSDKPSISNKVQRIADAYKALEEVVVTLEARCKQLAEAQHGN